MASMASHLHAGNFVYYPSSPSFTDDGVTSRASPITYQWMTPIVGISQQPTTRTHTMVPYLHGRSGEQAEEYRNRGITIEILPEDTLLEIFDFYRLDAMESSHGRPWKWHRLAHVCQKWRNVVRLSPRRLGLQIYCKSRGSIKRILSAWPTLPLVVQFKVTQKSKSLPKNALIALGHPDRVCEIDLTVKSPIIGSIIDMIQAPFPALERIEITSKDGLHPTTEPPVVGIFLGGFAPLLKEINLEGVVVPFPALRRLLLSTNNLVELRLRAVENNGYFSPDALVTVLSSLTQLKYLQIHFRPPASRANSGSTTRARPPPERIILPSLTRLDLYGASEYLEDFFARIDSPVLDILTIMFFNQLIFEIPQICRFMSRVERLEAFDEVDVSCYEDSMMVFVVLKWQDNSSRHRRDRQWCNLIVPCNQLDWQLSFASQILSQIREFLSSAKLLRIAGVASSSTWKDDVDPTQWPELFQPFSHVSDVRVEDTELAPYIMHALRVSDDMAAGLLPSLETLYMSGYGQSSSMKEDGERFIAAREAADRSITLRG